MQLSGCGRAGVLPHADALLRLTPRFCYHQRSCGCLHADQKYATLFEWDAMPVFTGEIGAAPKWCELESFEIVEIEAGGHHLFERLGAKEKLVVGSVDCHVSQGDQTTAVKMGDVVDIVDTSSSFEVATEAGALVVRMSGRWGDEIGGAGVFSVVEVDSPTDSGDDVSYLKKTTFDNHYHDCDEYWIVYEGSGLVVSEGRAYLVGPGDCLATGIGHHHDFPQVSIPVTAVYFETTLEGDRRLGHLWNHTHGAAVPDRDRV